MASAFVSGGSRFPALIPNETSDPLSIAEPPTSKKHINPASPTIFRLLFVLALDSRHATSNLPPIFASPHHLDSSANTPLYRPAIYFCWFDRPEGLRVPCACVAHSTFSRSRRLHSGRLQALITVAFCSITSATGSRSLAQLRRPAGIAFRVRHGTAFRSVTLTVRASRLLAAAVGETLICSSPATVRHLRHLGRTSIANRALPCYLHRRTLLGLSHSCCRSSPDLLFT